MIRKKIPEYRKLYEMLRKQIVDGYFEEGSLLPSENELCRVHDLTRPTVRRALDSLVQNGFIVKHQGKGSIVMPSRKGLGVLSRCGITSAIGEDKLQTRFLVGPVKKEWPEDFFYHLTEEEKEAGCLFFERIRYVRELPVFVDVGYIPDLNIKNFKDLLYSSHSLFQLLKDNYQVRVTGGEQLVSAISANERLAHLLEVSDGFPLVKLQRKMETNRMNFNIYSEVYCNTQGQALYGIF